MLKKIPIKIVQFEVAVQAGILEVQPEIATSIFKLVPKKKCNLQLQPEISEVQPAIATWNLKSATWPNCNLQLQPEISVVSPEIAIATSHSAEKLGKRIE